LKRKSIFLLMLISILFIVEIIIIYWSNSHYYLIINTGFYISLIYLQAVFIFSIINGGRTKRILVLNVFLILIIPLLFLNSLPKYTYNNAKITIKNELHVDDIAFESVQNKTIPVGGSHKFNSWLVNDYFYYYIVNFDSEYHYFYVDPFKGSVYELEMDFYRDGN
jgi:hypothetical protein